EARVRRIRSNSRNDQSHGRFIHPGRCVGQCGGLRIMGNPYDTANERTSVIGPTLRFKGELHADEELLIRGQVEGSITHSQRITVCTEGIVKASIKAQIIAVEGTVEGDLQAEKSVQVKDSARIKGNIHAPSVSIVDGAHFNGSVAMDVG